MASVINSNISSLTAQRNLGASQSMLSTSIQRLSSGLRINSAKDDSAGLAISERMTSQIRGLNQAARNANDGISLAQTAEGALGQVGNNLQRIRELAVQASNGTNSQVDRDALQAEVGQLKAEIQRVAEQTSFNGQKLLDGSNASFGFQVGANAGETITVSNLANVSLGALGGQSIRTTATAQASTMTGFATPVVAGDLTINGYSVGPIAAAANAQERAGQVTEAINRVSAQSGVGASYDATTGSVTLTSASAINIAGNGATAAISGFAANVAAGTSTTTNGIGGLTVSSFTDAQTTIVQIDKALAAVNSSRATLGAVQNRFESVVASVQIASENTSAARSRIQDADFAAETSTMSKAQILQQAGTAMVAQANQVSQNVLSLLK